MTSQRLLGIPALVLLSACATSGVTPRSVLVPRDGPRAHISASYMGGITARSLRASFSVDKEAYVMVGHLAGDGRIRILYPESPATSNRVQARKYYSVRAKSAQYDAVPQLFSYASRAYRSVSARHDSYDGRGNGFVFIVASAYPLDLRDFGSEGEWDAFEVDDYTSTSDPRYSINAFAQQATGGAPFTLDYADSFMTQSYSSFASNAVDCSMIYGILGGFMSSTSGFWGFGYGLRPYFRQRGFGGYSPFYSYGYGSFFGNAGCGNSDYGPYFNTAMFLPRRQYPGWGSAPTLTPPPDSSPSTALPVAPAWGGRAHGGRDPGSIAGGSPSRAPQNLGSLRQRFGNRSTDGGPHVPRSREIESFTQNRPTFDAVPRTRADRPSHNGANRGDPGGRISRPSPASSSAPISRPAPSAPSRASNPSPASRPSTTEIIRPSER